MKKRLLVFWLIGLVSLSAHDHLDVGIDPGDESRLGFHGLSVQFAFLVPLGEFFSDDTPNFPGGYYANQLTFVTETYVLDPALRSAPRIEFLSVSGPEGGVFSYWEAGATAPTLSMPSGWMAPPATPLSFPVEIGGDGHIHGRIFTATRAGTYQVTFRATDINGLYAPSASKTLTFHFVQPPPLKIGVARGNVELEFPSRTNLSYDLQSSTTLAPNSWQYVATLEGTGTTVRWFEPLSDRPRVFYRLVEYP